MEKSYFKSFQERMRKADEIGRYEGKMKSLAVESRLDEQSKITDL